MIKPRTRIAFGLVLAGFVVTVSTLAQDAPTTEPQSEEDSQRQTPSFLGREASQGVYVRDSTVAVERFALANRMERLKEWDKAADALQELVEKHPDRVVPSKTYEDDVIYQYTSVTRAVHEQLSKWPDAGLDSYRARFESVAAEMLAENPDDLATLNGVYTRYFPTDTAKAAAITLIDRHLEAGEFPAAAWLGERLLRLHPRLGDDRPMVLYRTALAYHLSGDASAAKPAMDELAQKHADAKGTVRGEEVNLVDSLQAELKTAPPVARITGAESWPMVGGSPNRSGLSSAVGRMGAKICDIPYLTPIAQAAPIAADRRRWNREPDDNARERGQLLGIMPAIDRGELFFQDNANVYAVNLDSGVTLPGWAATYANRNGVYTAPRAHSLPRNLQSAVALTDSEVLAITGQLDRESVARGMLQRMDREARLVCLDRKTGVEKWTATTRGLPDQAAELRGMELGGSPLVVGDQVFVVARGGKPNAFEDCYVLCFGLSDGAYRWSCYLASGNTAGEAFDGFYTGLARDAIPHLAYASGRVYALTNLGALASIDAYNGATVWLNLYPRPSAQFVDFRRRMENPEAFASPRPWEQNPVIVNDGHVFVLPADGEHLLVYDAGSGAELKRIPLSELGNARALIAAFDDKVVLTGRSEVYCVNWPGYTPEADLFDNLFWQAPMPRSSDSESSIRGRAFVTKEAVFVPTKVAIMRISLDTGRAEDSYPRNRQWSDGEGPGNIVITQDHVVIAGDEGVDVYTDLAIARAKLDAALAAAPNDPNARLEYAEVMFVAGEYEDAAQRLDEAIALLGGLDGLRSGPARDRVFNIALTFGQKLTATSDPTVQPTEPQRQLAGELFDRAEAAASTPAQQVNYRITRAELARVTHDLRGQLRLYQEILEKPDWRSVPLTSREDGSSASAAQVSETAIAQILEEPGGSEAYAAVQEQAAEALQDTRRQDDPTATLEIARRFPNTDAAPVAMLAAAEQYEAAGQHRTATQVLNQVVRKYGEQIDRTELIEAQVRNYAHLRNGLAVSIRHLATGVKIASEHRFEKPVTLPDGTTLEAGTTFAAALDTLRQSSASVALAGLPQLGIPIPESGKRPVAFVPESQRPVIENIDKLLVPVRDFPRHDRIVTFNAGEGISIFEPGGSTPLATTAGLGEVPIGCAWVGDEGPHLLVWGQTAIALLTSDGSDVQWRVPLQSMTELQVVSPSEGVIVDGPVEDGDQIVMILPDNQRIRMRGRRVPPQNNIWANQNPNVANAPNPGGLETIVHVCPLGDRVILATSSGRVAAIEYANKQIAWQIRLSARGVHQLIAADDFAVARVVDDLGHQLIALDTFSGQITYRRAFVPDGHGVPVNMTLAPDGTLVYTLTNRICAKNLYSDSPELDFQYPQGNDAGPVYIGANLPDQLVVAEDRIIAVSDNGVLVRVHSLETGKELVKAFTTGASNWNVRVRVIGPKLYVITPSGVTGYDLESPDQVWQSVIDIVHLQDAFVGDDYLVLLDSMATERDAMRDGVAAAAAQRANEKIGSPRFRLCAIGRYPARPGETIESGRWDYAVQVTHPVGITEWQPVHGGFYYHSADRKLHFLKGSAAK